MNILGLVFSASSLFQQSDHKSSLEKDELKSMCPVAGACGPLENITNEGSQGIKCQEQPSDSRCSKFSSSGLTDVNKKTGTTSALSHASPAKRPVKKKKRKKGKANILRLDDNIASKSCDISKISLSTGLENDQSNTAVHKLKQKEMISKYVHDKADVKLGLAFSELNLNAEGSNSVRNIANTKCLTSMNKISSDVAASQDLASGKKKARRSNAKSARNQEKSTEAVRVSSTSTSATASDPVSVLLESTRVEETKPTAVLAAAGNPNHIQVQAAPEDEICRTSESFGKGSAGFSSEVGRSAGPPFSKSLPADSSICCPETSHNLDANEDSGGIRDDVKSSNQQPGNHDTVAISPIQNPLAFQKLDTRDSCVQVASENQSSGVYDAPAVQPVQVSEHSKAGSQLTSSTSHVSYSMLSRKKIGKENANLTWQKTGRFLANSEGDDRSICNHNDLCADAASSCSTSFSTNHFFKGDGLLPPPQATHYGKDSFQQKLKHQPNSQKVYKTQAQIEASEGTFRENFHAKHGQYAPRARKDDVTRDFSWERLRNKISLPPKQENTNHRRKGLWVSKPNLDKSGDSKTFLHEIKPTDEAGTKSIESAYVSSIDEDTSSVCSGTELPCDVAMKELFTSRATYKWIPLSKRDSVSEASRGGDQTNNGKVNHYQEAENAALCGIYDVSDMAKDVNEYDSLPNGEQRNLERDNRVYCSAADQQSSKLPLNISSHQAEQAIKASYTSHMSAESFQLVTGIPIAQFEKLLCSASPLINLSSTQQHMNYVTEHRDAFVLSSCTAFPRLHITLQDIWSWYEGPGNYGLQVKAEDSLPSKGLKADVPFHAHFVPFLSAVQLFGRLEHFNGGLSENASNGRLGGEHAEGCSCPSISSLKLVAEMSSSGIGSKDCSIASGTINSDEIGGSLPPPSVPDDSHLIFEYFEHEPPQLRKPLFAKIKELLVAGNANTQIYGDPSKLESMDIQDLHPASWYSVAWYPIYRIPEGCFRASFLTYHSLGHVFLRCPKAETKEKDMFQIVLPALGMQSYNAKGERWLCPKKSEESVLQDGKTLSCLLSERLRALGDTAALFSRGQILGDHTPTTNRHPDYEFFLSRKQ